MSKPRLDDLNDRVWYAWQCLPRSAKGRPPPWKPMEREYKIGLATFAKLASDERRSLDTETLVKVAAALKVSTDWLSKGEGTPPTPTGPIQSRADKYALTQTTDGLAEKAEAAGGAAALAHPRNNLEIAVLTLLKEIRPEAIADVVRDAAGSEDAKPPHQWGYALRDRERFYQRADEAEKPKSEVKPSRKPSKKKPIDPPKKTGTRG